MNTLREYVTTFGCERSRRRAAAITSAGTSLPEARIRRIASSGESASPPIAFDSSSSTGGESRLWIRNTVTEGRNEEGEMRRRVPVGALCRPCAAPSENPPLGGAYGCGGAPRRGEWPGDLWGWKGHPAPPSSRSSVIVAPAAGADKALGVLGALGGRC